MIWLRRVGAVIVGIAIAFLFVTGAEAIVHKLYPPPPGTNMDDFNQVKKFVASLPTTAYVLVLTGWLLGTLLGTFAAAKIGLSAIPAYVAGGLLLAGGIANSIIIPQPIWFSVVSFVIYIGATLVGARLGH